MIERKIWVQSLMIVIGSTLLALLFNAVRAEGIPLIAPDRSVSAETGDEDVALGNVDLAGAKALFDAGAIFIDARSTAEYERGHIAGAVHLYYADFDVKAAEVVGSMPLDKTVVSYCSGEDCNSSDIVARHLIDYGFEKVRIFFAGWPAWEAAGYPKEGSGEAAPLYGDMGVK